MVKGLQKSPDLPCLSQLCRHEYLQSHNSLTHMDRGRSHFSDRLHLGCSQGHGALGKHCMRSSVAPLNLKAERWASVQWLPDRPGQEFAKACSERFSHDTAQFHSSHQMAHENHLCQALTQTVGSVHGEPKKVRRQFLPNDFSNRLLSTSWCLHET